MKHTTLYSYPGHTYEEFDFEGEFSNYFLAGIRTAALSDITVKIFEITYFDFTRSSIDHPVAVKNIRSLELDQKKLNKLPENAEFLCDVANPDHPNRKYKPVMSDDIKVSASGKSIVELGITHPKALIGVLKPGEELYFQLSLRAGTVRQNDALWRASSNIFAGDGKIRIKTLHIMPARDVLIAAAEYIRDNILPHIRAETKYIPNVPANYLHFIANQYTTAHLYEEKTTTYIINHDPHEDTGIMSKIESFIQRIKE